jgi:hypothetical protein
MSEMYGELATDENAQNHLNSGLESSKVYLDRLLMPGRLVVNSVSEYALRFMDSRTARVITAGIAGLAIGFSTESQHTADGSIIEHQTSSTNSLNADRVVSEIDYATVKMNGSLDLSDTPPIFDPNTATMRYNYADLNGPCNKKTKKRGGIFSSDTWQLISGANVLAEGYCQGSQKQKAFYIRNPQTPSYYDYTNLTQDIGEDEAQAHKVPESSHGEPVQIYASLTQTVVVRFAKPNTANGDSVTSVSPYSEIVIQDGRMKKELRY